MHQLLAHLSSRPGFEKTFVMGRDLVDDFISEAFKQSVSLVLQKALDGQETSNFEFPLYTKDGQRVDVLLNAATRRDASGNAIGVVGVGQDISERKQAEKQLKTLAKDLQKLIDTANAPIFGIDVEGRVNEWNLKAANITGLYTGYEGPSPFLASDGTCARDLQSIKLLL